jgi:hypothetical protein
MSEAYDIESVAQFPFFQRKIRPSFIINTHIAPGDGLSKAKKAKHEISVMDLAGNKPDQILHAYQNSLTSYVPIALRMQRKECP